MNTTDDRIQIPQETDENRKPRPKPITEKRRLQNRQAQKTFREKTKKQKQLLKQLRSTQSNFAISTPFSSILPPYNAETALSPASASYVQRDESLDACQFPTDTIYQTPNYSPDELYHSFMSEELPLSAQQDQSIIPVSFQSIHQPERSGLTPWHDIVKLEGKSTFPVDSIAHLLLQNDDQIDGQVLNDIVRKRLTIEDILRAGLRSLSAGASPNKVPNTVLTPSDTSPTRSPVNIVYLFNQTPTRIPDSGCEEIGNYNPRTGRMKMQFVSLPLRAACTANAAMLGIPSSILDSKRDKSDTLLGFSLNNGTPEAAMKSLFYRPMLDQQTAEEMCKQDFADTKPDLRPGVAQLLNHHNAYLDTLPFPVFRERAINLICTNPSMIDERELVQDLLNNGLICWTPDQNGSNAAGVTGAPWDFRSWEAQPWFLRKWWILVGGTEGEMYLQTVWWRGMRGESIGDLLPSNERLGLHVR
ncbi:hypothetical protein VTN00DRAFT_5144 [Thermoascus crustaceus]|uniref:uncharacterized protein n=1 Tax=Thermoascus crustaceus TaxID=5088 RepID=UPI003744AC92